MDHLAVEIRMIPDHDLWIPAHGDKDRIHAARDGSEEDLADLQANDERKGHNDWCKLAALIVSRVCKFEVQIGQQCTEIRDEHGAH